MKKMFRRFIALLGSATLLTGCSLDDIFGESKKTTGIKLVDYSKTVIVDTEYKYDGKVFLQYEDETEEEEVTNECIYTTLDTSKMGDSTFEIRYEATDKIYTKVVHIEVIAGAKLTSISASDYTSEVEYQKEYSFDGKVTAKYDNGLEADVTSKATIGTIDTSSTGEKNLTISYEEGGVSKAISETVHVWAKLDSLIVQCRTSFTTNETFSFEGSVSAVYADGSSKDITQESEITNNVQNGVVGEYQLTASYTERGVTKSATVAITVATYYPKVTGISIGGNYTTSVNKGATYIFDGVITASYENGTSGDVTAETQFSINTATGGKKTLTASFTDVHNNNKKFTATTQIDVLAELINISASNLTVGVGQTVDVSVTCNPSDAYPAPTFTYATGNSSYATVSASGKVTGVAAGETTLTVTSNNGKVANATITVTETPQDAWTILLYLCGADLESGGDYGLQYGGAATDDIKEILSVSGQPDDVNFVIQTGGASAWKSTYGISASYNQRYHVANKSLVKDNNQVYSSYKGMGEASTLKDFLVWGLQTYPADKVGLILWNHGGGLDGVCYDEKKSDNSLTNNEVVTAVSGALTETGLSKLEFIGYDACLMQMMEIAEFNAPYFNYQIASQESEAGTGWDYDTWVDDLYAKKSSDTIFKAIIDGFISDNGGVNGSGSYYQGQYYAADQTLSYLDLSKVSDFKTNWESLATQVKSKITTSNKSTFKDDVVGASKYFAGEDYARFAEFDCYDFLDKLAANETFNPGGNYISNARTALSNLVKYNVVQKEGAADAHGLSFYFGKTYNSSTYSHFTNWVSLVSTVGGFSQSGGWY